MKLVDYVVYKDSLSGRRFASQDELLEMLNENKFEETPFQFYVEVAETDEIVVFAELFGFGKETFDKNGRYYSVETCVLVKRDMELYHFGDNDFAMNHLDKLVNKPVWTQEQLESEGIFIQDLPPRDFPYDHSWFHYCAESGV